MRIGVVGMGNVGLVTAACFSHLGHDVLGLDVDVERIELLRKGQMPFFEPHLEHLVREGIDTGRLRFVLETQALADECEAIFICVGTPPTPSGEADLSQIERLAWNLGSRMDGYTLLVEKSTVPVRTGDRIEKTLRLAGAGDVEVVSNPEFLREGSAVGDTLSPDRIVIGSGSERATKRLLELYDPVIERSGCEVIITDVGTAELIKHASNAFLATKISFINSVAEVCEASGADVETVARGMGMDKRIGRSFLRAGAGYGGSCFPKDVAAFEALGEELGCDMSLLRAVQAINDRAVGRVLDKLRDQLWHLKGKRVAVLGLSFKPGTSDLRESPAMKLVVNLLDEGAEVVAYDPVAMPSAKEVLPPQASFAASPLEAAQGAHAVAVMTEWKEFEELDLKDLRDALDLPIIVDGRNLFDPRRAADLGLTYLPAGRPPVIG